MLLGWGAGTAINSIEELRAEARYAVGAGFDALWVSQIFGVDPVVALAAAASDVEPLAEVGTSIVPIYGRHSLALAAMARTAQSALGGRFTLGIGPSHAMVVEGFYGESYERPFTHTAEFVEALDPLLRGEPCDVEGEEITAKGWLTVESEPVPILLAALGPRMMSGCRWGLRVRDYREDPFGRSSARKCRIGRCSALGSEVVVRQRVRCLRTG